MEANYGNDLDICSVVNTTVYRLHVNPVSKRRQRTKSVEAWATV